MRYSADRGVIFSLRTLLGIGITIIAVVALSVLLLSWPRIDACNSGSLTTIIEIRGTPSVANPVYSGQSTWIEIAGNGQMAGADPGTFGTPIPGATATLLVNNTVSGSTTLGSDSKGYVIYTFPVPGNYTVSFQMSYKQYACAKQPLVQNSFTLTVTAR